MHCTKMREVKLNCFSIHIFSKSRVEEWSNRVRVVMQLSNLEWPYRRPVWYLHPLNHYPHHFALPMQGKNGICVCVEEVNAKKPRTNM